MTPGTPSTPHKSASGSSSDNDDGDGDDHDDDLLHHHQDEGPLGSMVGQVEKDHRLQGREHEQEHQEGEGDDCGDGRKRRATAVEDAMDQD